MSRGELACERYAQALLDRCAQERALNAFITLDPGPGTGTGARSRRRAPRGRASREPLFGLPIPVKDSVNTRDYPTTGGTPALRAFRPQADAPVVAALKAAGALVLGKTNLHELSYGWTSNNLAFGAVRNPYDHTRIPGGSSGGTAAAIAARLAPLGIAEDTEGSIRVPAAFCGIAGFRPTTGRYSTEGCVPISPLFDQVGPHARSVADLVLFDSVVTREAPLAPAASLRGVRLGVARDYWFAGLDPEVERITADALRRLEDAGAVLVEAPLPGVASLVDRATDQIQNHDVRLRPRPLSGELTERPWISQQLIEQASPDIQAVFRSYVLPGGENFVTEPVYTAARDRYVPELKRAYRDYFAQPPAWMRWCFPQRECRRPSSARRRRSTSPGMPCRSRTPWPATSLPAARPGCRDSCCRRGSPPAACRWRSSSTRRRARIDRSCRSQYRSSARSHRRTGLRLPGRHDAFSASDGIGLDYRRLSHRHPR
jgi:Asp-tRNA(Asn)/Glu-tRNA(Gln) amidotransferase A subunit family amidase